MDNDYRLKTIIFQIEKANLIYKHTKFISLNTKDILDIALNYNEKICKKFLEKLKINNEKCFFCFVNEKCENCEYSKRRKNVKCADKKGITTRINTVFNKNHNYEAFKQELKIIIKNI